MLRHREIGYNSAMAGTGADGPIEMISRGVLVEHGRVLVCRNLTKGHAYLPGGHIEPGETAAEAVARELAEEAGLAVRVGGCLVVAEVLVPGLRPPLHEVNLVFHVERDGEDPIVSREPGLGFEWIELAGVVDTDLRPRALKAWLMGGRALGRGGIEFISDRELG
jgi:8-oxo-dGTP pyrophosphatase MutT (NUDIX family)